MVRKSRYHAGPSPTAIFALAIIRSCVKHTTDPAYMTHHSMIALDGADYVNQGSRLPR